MVFKVFTAKDGKEIVIRSILPSDIKRAKEFADFLNSIIIEGEFLVFNTKKTTKEEKEVLKIWNANQGKNSFHIIAEYKGKIIGKAEIAREKEIRSHVAGLGLALADGYREIGIGTEIMKILISEAEKWNLKFLRLDVIATNKRAQGIYKKFGFREVARIPQQYQIKKKLVDEIIMLKEL